MVSKQSTVVFILEQISEAGSVSCRKMFGEYAVYCDKKTVALVCDDQLFVKPTISGKAFIGSYEEGYPFEGAKPWLYISGDYWDNHEWLTRLIVLTAAELPLPKPKTKTKTARKKSKNSKKTE